MLTLETTSQNGVRYYRNFKVVLRKSQDIELGRTWVFTDGSNSGWFAAVVVDTKARTVRYGATKLKPISANVGPELCGLVLGLRLAPDHSPITVVHDYNGVGAWAVGAWAVKTPHLLPLITKARDIIKERKLDVHFVHHGGHQDNGTDFTRWNNEADKLCSAQVETDRTGPWT